MTRLLQQQIEAVGAANVICILAPSAATSTSPAMLEKHFVDTELSQLASTWRATDGLAAAAAAGGQPTAGTQGLPAAARMRYYPRLGVTYGTVDREGLAALKADPAVKDVLGAPQLSLVRPVATAAAATPSGPTWGLQALGVPALWDRNLTGKGVTVAHLDTGVDGTHPVLKDAVAGFAEFDGLGRQTSRTTPFDSGEHGTHTAATIAGRRSNGNSVGVAPEARLACAVVIEGGDAVARVLAGLDWAIEQHARVLSMSLGFRGWWPDFEPLVKILRENGIVPVIAVGNEGPGTSRSPGNYAEALSIGAHDQSGAVAYFSSSQHFSRRREALVPDVLAPGVDVTSAKPLGGFQMMSGTSMATPHVAGVLALLVQADPDASVYRLERAIFDSATPSPAGPANMVRKGIVHAEAALERLRASRR